MAYVPQTGSTVAFQGTVPWSVLGAVTTTGSVISVNQGSIAAYIIGGSVAAMVTPPANQSVSGVVGASILGTVPVTQVTSPWIITGSVQASVTPAANQSVSGTVGASIIGAVPVRVEASIAAVIIGGSIAASFTPPANQSVSGTVGASIIGSVPVTGSIAALQGTNPWVVTGSVQGTVGASIIGLVPVTVTTTDIFPATQNITTVDVASSTAVGANGQSIIIGTPTAGSAASFTVSGVSTIRVEVTGIWTGTLTSEQSIDGGTTWVGQGLHQGAYTTGSWTAGFVGGGNVAGATNYRIRATAAITGTAVVKVVQSVNEQSMYIANAAPAGTVISLLNSTTATLGIGGVYTGTGEDVSNFSEMRISVFADQASATDGLSIQQSTNNTNWDIVDTYTIPASTGKTFVVPRQARYFRMVYTNGGTGQGAFRLQSILNRTATAPSSQRPTDGYSNETDLVQNQMFGMVYNGTTWDRVRGNTTNGMLVYGSVQAVATPNQSVSGTVGASLIGLSPVFVSNFPVSENVNGSVISFQGGTWNVFVAGSVATVGAAVANQSVSGTVGASIIGQLPAGTAVLGSIAALQVTNPWVVTGSVQAVQVGTQITSILSQTTGTSSTYAVKSSVTAVSIMAANANRRGGTIFNNTSTMSFVQLGTVVTSSLYTLKMADQGYYELPFGYTGVVGGITASNAGIWTVTEFT